jgi:hypothetical protein
MDSTVYKYLIGELQSERDAGFDLLPLHIVVSPPPPNATSGRDAFASLVSFLNGLTDSTQTVKSGMPLFFSSGKNFFRFLFLTAHIALADILSGADPVIHLFRPSGMQLVKFLTFCAHDDTSRIVPESDVASLAMLCFLTEGMMYAGWCPNAFEARAKRAAHSYFIILKKSLHHAQAQSLATVLGYLWGAWLLAQKTEGIRDTSPLLLPKRENDMFDWTMGTDHRIYLAQKSTSPPLFYMLAKVPTRIAHPFAFVSYDEIVGLSIKINGEVVRSVSLRDSIEIDRQKISGHKFMYACQTESIPDFSWTVVVLHYESTLYRIDILTFPEAKKRIRFSSEMSLECALKPEPTDKNSYISKGVENTVIRFLENPLQFEFDRLGQNGISIFASHDVAMDVTESLRLVTAWATGRGITAINETKLLGIYD